MLSAKNIPKQLQRKPISARLLNALVGWATLAGRLGAAAPLAIDQLPGGPCLRWAGPIVDIRIAQTGSGGIDPRQGTTPGQADVTLQYLDRNTGQLASYDLTVTANNLSQSKVGPNEYIKICRINDDWWVFWEDCPNSGS